MRRQSDIPAQNVLIWASYRRDIGSAPGFCAELTQLLGEQDCTPLGAYQIIAQHAIYYVIAPILGVGAWPELGRFV